MKADHRHELKTNELADWLTHFPQWAQENRTTLIAAGVAIVVLIGVYFVRFYRKDVDVRQHVQLTNLVTQVSAQKQTIAQAASQGTDQSVTLLPIAQDLQSFAQGSGNDRMAALALIKRAEAIRMELHYRLTAAGREEVAKQIAQAQTAYRAALERASSNPTLAAAAELGLGLCDEELGNFEEAKAAYRQVAENADYEGTAAQAAAAHRLKTVDDYRGAVIFPPAPEPNPAAASAPTIQLGPGAVNPPITIEAVEGVGVTELPVAAPDGNDAPSSGAAVEVNEPASN